MIIKFETPVEFEGKKYPDVEIKCEDMSGAQLKDLIKRYSRDNKITNPLLKSATVVTWDDDFAIFVAQDLSDKPFEFFDALKASDYMLVVSMIQGFFNGSASRQQEA